MTMSGQAKPQEKPAAEQEAVGRARAFEVGVAHLCRDGGFRYTDLAEKAGQTNESLGPELQKQVKEAAEAHEAAQTK